MSAEHWQPVARSVPTFVFINPIGTSFCGVTAMELADRRGTEANQGFCRCRLCITLEIPGAAGPAPWATAISLIRQGKVIETDLPAYPAATSAAGHHSPPDGNAPCASGKRIFIDHPLVLLKPGTCA